MSGITITGSVTIDSGVSLGGTPPGPGPSPGVDNVIGYLEMNPPVVPGQQLEDFTATINGSTGFTINNDATTGVAIPDLSASNQAWFGANFTAGNVYTCTWGAGSTVASSSVLVATLSGAQLVMYILGQSGPATYNYPFTFSV